MWSRTRSTVFCLWRRCVRPGSRDYSLARWEPAARPVDAYTGVLVYMMVKYWNCSKPVIFWTQLVQDSSFICEPDSAHPLPVLCRRWMPWSWQPTLASCVLSHWITSSSTTSPCSSSWVILEMHHHIHDRCQTSLWSSRGLNPEHFC